MYALAGIVLERVTGQAWESVLESRIFIPLGMRESNASIEHMIQSSNYSLAYADMERGIEVLPYQDLSTINPGGGINSNITDLFPWVQEQLSGKLLFKKQETLQEMHSIQIPFSLVASKNEGFQNLGYALGWYIGRYRDHDVVTHAGQTAGFCSDISFLPKEKIGVIILTNSSRDGYYLASTLKNMIFDHLLEKNSMDWLKMALEERNQVNEKLKRVNEEEWIDISEDALQKYVGVFYHPAYDHIKIYIEKDRLMASYDGIAIPLRYKKEHTFMGSFHVLLAFGINPWVEFTFKENTFGEISELWVPFEAFRNGKPIVFHRSGS